ncbi:MAG: cell division protein ZapB [Nitrospirae bacterium]|nr:cell division protein ZapB [Nitrospirota bacterium]MBI3594523.1 cell division protein ZapB [Nitrospirota bacterium]
MEKLEILEVQIRKMMEMIKLLRNEKGLLETEVKAMSEKILKLEEENRFWENEKSEIRVRIENILGEMEGLPH